MPTKLPKITEKEKNTPAFRKKLEQENDVLKKSVKAYQDQASSLQVENQKLQIDNAVKKQKLDGSGIDTFSAGAFFLFLGVAVPYLIDQKFMQASISLGLAVIVVFIYIGIKAFKSK